MLALLRRLRRRAAPVVINVDGSVRDVHPNDARGFGAGAHVRVVGAGGRIVYDGPSPVPEDLWRVDDAEADLGGYTFTVVLPCAPVLVGDLEGVRAAQRHLRLVD